MKVTPEHKVINDLFGNDIKYIIPEYQRPYSWDCLGKSDKNNQVNVMWDDLMAFFNQPNNDTYFLGTMVLITTKGNDREFQVVDGQQRLTTLVLLFVAIKCFLTKQKQTITDATLKNFIDETVLEVDNLMYNKIKFGALTVAQLKAAINAAIKDNDTAKLLIAKYVWVIETKTDDDVMIQTLDYSKATLEHIIPQKPDTHTNWLTDFNPKFRDTYTYRLGNMTLLTHALNASARNFDYDEKRKRYAKTKLFITAELPEIITATFIEKRQQKIVTAILEDLEL